MGFSVQLKAMMTKNWIQKKVNKRRTILEMIMPIIFGVIIGVISVSVHNNASTGIGQVLEMWLLILFLSPVNFSQGVIFIISQMVADKESKMRETLKIMGLSREAYSFSYLVMQGIISTFAALLFTIAIWYPYRADTSGYVQLIATKDGQMSVLLLFIAIFALGISIQTLAAVVSTLFSDAKLATQVAPLLLFFPSTIALVFAVEAATPALGYSDLCRTLIQCFYFIPQFPFEVVVMDAVAHGGSKSFLGIDPKWAWAALILQPLAYFACYLYLDNVIPNAFGISRGCFYCLPCRRREPIRESEL